MERQKYIEAGEIISTHGIAGEVKVEVWLDSPEFFKKFKRVFIGEKEFAVESYKKSKGFLIAKLKGIDDINAAMNLKNRVVSVDRSDVPLPKNSCFVCDLIGAKVTDEAGNEIGTLTEVMESPAQPVYIVRGETEHLIPAVPEFIRFVDAGNGIIRVRLIEGM